MELIKKPVLVVCGAFNNQILRNGAWIKRNLFPKSEQEKILVNLNVAYYGDTISSNVIVDGIEIMTVPGKIIITPPSFDSDGFDAINELIINLSSTLPHTPVTSFGINFTLFQSLHRSMLDQSQMFNFFPDGAIPPKKMIQSSIPFEDAIMNFSLEEELTENGMTKQSYNFNFHSDISGEEPLIQVKTKLLDNCIERYLNHAQSFAGYITEHLR